MDRGTGAYQKAETKEVDEMRRCSIQDFLTLPRLTPSRRKMALERMATVARERGLVALEAPIRASIAVQDKALLLEQQRRETAKDHAIHADGAPAMDAELDR